MADKCPKCGETLITRTIQKKIGLGSIDFPVAEICPKCNWNRDLTGAGDIVAKPPMPVETGTAKDKKTVISGQSQEKQEKVLEVTRTVPEKSKQVSEIPQTVPEKPKPAHKRVIDMGKIVTIALILLVSVAIISAFTSKVPEQTSIDKPTQSESIITPSATPSPTIIPQVTQTGNNITVKIDRDRGYINSAQQNLKIRPGDGVIWKNDGIYPLTLVSNENLFKDKLLDNEKITDYIFKNTGTYGFTIIVKGEKKFSGTVTVEP